MDLGFNVNRGPLSQINLSIMSFDMAVHLATGAYGWWKARSRSETLSEVLASKYGQLSASTRFNHATYVSARSRQHIRGVAFNEGRLESLDLPKASTAMDGDIGM